MRITGNVTIDVCDAETGRLLRREVAHNLVLLVGRNMIRDALFGDPMTPPNRMALGTSATPVSPSQISLGAEVWRDVLTTRAKGSAAITFKYFLTSTTGNGTTFREAGLVNAAVGGQLFGRVVYAEIAKTASITILFAWTISIGAT